MINKELKKLSRKELVEVIYQLKKNEEKLQARIEEAEQELKDKRMRLAEAGSIADAAMGVTDVFSHAQAAADLYLQEVSCMKATTQQECDAMIENAKEVVDSILAEGKERYAALRAEIQTLEEQKRKLSEE
jgi:hypothetical protein